MSKTRILIADDHPLFVDGLRALLETVEDFQILGSASDGQQAVDLAAALQPDLILMDIQMPGLNGIEATLRILESNPQARILILTMFEDEGLVFTALRAGARGYLLKGARQEEALRAIHAVANDEVIFGSRVARHILQHLKASQPEPSQEAFLQLSPREREVLSLIAQSLSNDEIAARLVISPKTVRNHITHIFEKLQVSNRTEAIQVTRATRLGNTGNTTQVQRD